MEECNDHRVPAMEHPGKQTINTDSLTHTLSLASSRAQSRRNSHTRSSEEMPGDVDCCVSFEVSERMGWKGILMSISGRMSM